MGHSVFAIRAPVRHDIFRPALVGPPQETAISGFRLAKIAPFFVSSDKRKHVATIARVTRAVRWPDTVPGTTGDRFERSSLLRRRTVIAYALPALPVAAVNLVRATVPGSARASRTRATRVPAELVGGAAFQMGGEVGPLRPDVVEMVHGPISHAPRPATSRAG